MHLIKLNKVYQIIGRLHEQPFVQKTALVTVVLAISKEHTPSTQEIEALYKEKLTRERKRCKDEGPKANHNTALAPNITLLCPPRGNSKGTSH